MCGGGGRGRNKKSPKKVQDYNFLNGPLWEISKETKKSKQREGDTSFLNAKDSIVETDLVGEKWMP